MRVRAVTSIRSRSHIILGGTHGWLIGTDEQRRYPGNGTPFNDTAAYVKWDAGISIANRFGSFEVHENIEETCWFDVIEAVLEDESVESATRPIRKIVLT